VRGRAVPVLAGGCHKCQAAEIPASSSEIALPERATAPDSRYGPKGLGSLLVRTVTGFGWMVISPMEVHVGAELVRPASDFGQATRGATS